MKVTAVFFTRYRASVSILLLLSISLLWWGCAAKAPMESHHEAPADAELLAITAVSLSENASVVHVRSEGGPLTYTSLKQVDPLRVILYLPRTHPPPPTFLEPAVAGPILQVRADELPTVAHTTRVEILLAQDLPYDVSATENSLLISFETEADAAVNAGAAEPSDDGEAAGEKPLEEALAGDPASHVVATRRSDASRLLDIQSHSHAGGAEVHIMTDGPLRTYNAFTLTNPARIVFDLPPITATYPSEQVISLNASQISRIRHYGATDKLRIVLDTAPEWLDRYEAITLDNGLLIRVGQAGTELSTAAGPSKAASMRSPSRAVRITDLSFQQTPKGETAFMIAADGPLHHDIRLAGPDRMALHIFDARLDDHLAMPTLDLHQDQLSIRHATVTRVENDLRFLFDLREPTPYRTEESVEGLAIYFVSLPTVVSASATEAARPAVITAAATPEPQSQTESPVALKQPKYTGAPVSLDFYESDIKNVFRIIGAISGENIAVDPDVTGRVTLKLDTPVPWDQVLDLVLRMNQLDKVYEGNVIRVANQATLQKEEDARHARLEAEQRLRDQQIALEPLQTVYIPVNYATAETEVLHHIEKIVSERGRVSVDTRNNQIILTETAEKIQQARDLVKMLDLVTPQVMIEAKIVEASTVFAREIGTQWGVARGVQPPYSMPTRIYDREGEVGIYDSTAIPSDLNSMVGGSGGTYGTNVAVNLPVTSSAIELGFNFTRISGVPLLLNAKLQAMESKGEVKIISSPRIMTMDNKEAKIAQGVEVSAFKQFDQNGIAIYEYKQVDLALTVIPHVTLDERISVTIIVQKDDLGPIIDTRRSFWRKEANTELLVNNGDTIVIGGISKTNISFGTTGIPWLSKLPFIGWAFKSQTSSHDDEELLIFITPKIVRLEQTTNVNSAVERSSQLALPVEKQQ